MLLTVSSVRVRKVLAVLVLAAAPILAFRRFSALAGTGWNPKVAGESFSTVDSAPKHDMPC